MVNIKLGGSMEMDTDAALGAFNALGEAAVTLQTALDALKDAIYANEAGMGNCKVAQAFRPQYRVSKDVLGKSATAFPEIQKAFCDGGKECVADYQRTDEVHSARLRAVGRSSSPRTA